MHHEAVRDSFTPTTTPKISPYFLHHLGYNGMFFFHWRRGHFTRFAELIEMNSVQRHGIHSRHTQMTNIPFHIYPLASYMIHAQQHQVSHLLVPIVFLFFLCSITVCWEEWKPLCLCLSPCLERFTAIKEEGSAHACLAARKAVDIIYRGMVILL
ncbi:hypothetical protein ACQKWADRAFT_127904 [Trichoderma austrokoningii]